MRRAAGRAALSRRASTPTQSGAVLGYGIFLVCLAPFILGPDFGPCWGDPFLDQPLRPDGFFLKGSATASARCRGRASAPRKRLLACGCSRLRSPSASTARGQRVARACLRVRLPPASAARAPAFSLCGLHPGEGVFPPLILVIILGPDFDPSWGDPLLDQLVLQRGLF